MNVYILFPTARPEVAFERIKEWLFNRTELTTTIKFAIAVRTIEQYHILKSKLNSLSILPEYYIKIINNDIPGVCYPLYNLSYNLDKCYPEIKNEDIVIATFDDFHPLFSWDKFLYNYFFTKTKPQVFLTYDSIQDVNNIITLPIMNYAALKELNYIIYHPIYNHMCADEELYDVVREKDILLDIRKYDNRIFFEHRHYVNNKRNPDDLDKYVESKHLDDKLLYFSRKQLSIQEKLKINKAHIIKKNNFQSNLWNICILSIPKREKILKDLLVYLSRQLLLNVNITVNNVSDEYVSNKRNELLFFSVNRGYKYISYIDDDDLVSEIYIPLIAKILQKNNVDSVGLIGVVNDYNNKKNNGLFIHSIKYNKWINKSIKTKTINIPQFNLIDFEINNIYYRFPNHINPIRLECIIKNNINFNYDMNEREDRHFSNLLYNKKAIKSEYLITKPILYYYRDNIIK